MSSRLQERRIALLVSGGIAAMRAPDIARALRQHGAHVTAYLSEEATHYVGLRALEWATLQPVVTQLSARSEHLHSESAFDAFLVAPATYNTIGKLANGVADTVLTATLAPALGRLAKGRTRILIAPTMHGDFHNPAFLDNVAKLQKWGVDFIPPRDAYGKHNIPDSDVLAAFVCAATSDSPAKGKKILVTGGPTPVPLDSVRQMTNPFTGRLGLEIAKALFWRGADVHLILGGNAVTPPSYIETSRVQNFDDYRRQVCGLLDREPFDWGVFSAAVADYAPRSAFAGKLPSGQRDLNIELEPTAKVIDLVREAHPSLKMISFKYQENMSHADLIGVARERLRKGHQAVIANRGEELTAGGEQVAHLVTDDAVARLETKPGIAEGLCRFIERGSVRTDS